MYIEIILTVITAQLLSVVGGLWHIRKNLDKIEENGRTIGYLLVMVEQKMKQFLHINGIEDTTEVGDDKVNTKYTALSEMAKNAEKS